MALRACESILELVGNTPMVRLRRVVPEGAADVYAKLEYLNPGLSVKDRAALGMISDGLYATVAARAGRLLRSSARFGTAQRYVSGGIYVSLGAVAALSGSRSD